MKAGEWTARPPAGSLGWGWSHRTGEGNDPAAKPVCGTPRAGRRAAAVVSFLRWLRCGLASGRPRKRFELDRGTVPASRTACPEALKLRTMIREITGTRPAGQRMLEKENKRKKTDTSRDRNVSRRKIQLFDYQSEFAARPWLQGLVTVTRGVGRGVGRVVTRGTEANSTHSPARKLLMRASTSARGRPKRMRLVAMRRWGSDRRGGGASWRSRRRGDVGTPFRSKRAQAAKLGRSRTASGPPKPICRESIAASSAPARQAMIDPALPKTALRKSSGSWSRYWCPTVSVSAYLRASERMSAKLSVANDWNSSA